MSKMKQVFQEEQESRAIQDEWLDEEYFQRVREVNDRQRKVLNEIFESVCDGEILNERILLLPKLKRCINE